MQVSMLELWHLLSLCFLMLVTWKGITAVQVCGMAFGISLLPFHVKPPAVSDNDSICTLNNYAVFSFSHAFSMGFFSLNIWGLILLIWRVIDISIMLYL